MRKFKLIKNRIFARMTILTALVSTLAGFGAKPALAEENGTVDTSTPNTLEQVIDADELESQLQEESTVTEDLTDAAYTEETQLEPVIVDVAPVEQEIVEEPSEPEYTAYVADGNVNVVGDVNPEDLQKLDETINDIYDEAGNDVYIENESLEIGNNEIKTNGTDEGVTANVDEENKVTLEGEKVTEMNNLNQDFEVKEVTETSENQIQTEISQNEEKTEYKIEETAEQTKETENGQNNTTNVNDIKETANFELRKNEYAVVKDANGNYTLVFGEELPNAVDVVKLTNELKKNNKELANASFTYDKLSNVDMNGKEVVLKESKKQLGDKEYMVVKDKDGNYKIVIDSEYLTNENIDNIKNQVKKLHPEIDIDKIEIKTSKDVNLDETDIVESGYARGIKPTPDKPTPEPPTPDKPTPDKPTPDKPTPKKKTPSKSTPDKPTPNKTTPDNPTPVTPQTPNKNSKILPQTGDNTLETLNYRIMIAGLGAVTAGIAVRKKREGETPVIGFMDKETLNMISGKEIRIKGKSR